MRATSMHLLNTIRKIACPPYQIIFDEVIKDKELNQHIFKGNFKVIGRNQAGQPIYKVTGVHSNKTFLDGKVCIKQGTKSMPNQKGYYEGKVEMQLEGFKNSEGLPWKV